MEDSKESFGSGTDMSKLSSFEMALASSTFSEPSKASVFSEFADRDCGEPLEAHHLCLNFAPTDDDDDFSQRKCCEFWKYITSRRDLQGMMVRPEVPQSSQDTDTGSVKPCATEREARPKTAVSMLQIVEEKGLIDRAFEVKMQQSRCSLGSQAYELGTEAENTNCPCPGPCLKCPNLPPSNAHALCEELHAWDINHPKSMEPPQHPPSAESLVDRASEAKMQQRGSLGSHDEMGAKAENTGQTLKEAGYDKWNNGEPANSTQGSIGQYCGAVHRPGTLNDVWCNLPTPFICEKAPDNLVDEE